MNFGLRLVYGARILPVSPFPCGLREVSVRRREAAVRFSYGFTGSVASTILLKPQSHCPGSAAGLATDLWRASATNHTWFSTTDEFTPVWDTVKYGVTTAFGLLKYTDLRSMALIRPYSSTEPSRSYRELIQTTPDLYTVILRPSVDLDGSASLRSNRWWSMVTWQNDVIIKLVVHS